MNPKSGLTLEELTASPPAAPTPNFPYSVGYDPMDAQHEALLDSLQAMHGVCSSQAAPAELLAAFDRLIGFAAWHYDFEEVLMEKHGYPEIEEHKAEHRQLMDQLRSMEASLYQSTEQLSMDAVPFVQTWLKGHICGADKRLGEFLRNLVPEEF